MLQSPSEFLARTGRDYRPPSWLSALGRPLGPDESCGTLFRYPGPCGLSEMLGGQMLWLGAPGVDAVWMTDAVAHSWGRGARLFGTVAIVDPLHLDPVHADGIFDVRALQPHAEGGSASVFAGVNRPLTSADAFVWVPPSQIFADHPWATAADPDVLLRRFPGYAGERARVGDALGAYLEELGALRATGAEGPKIPWCEVPIEQRRKTLDHLGVRARWTVVA